MSVLFASSPDEKNEEQYIVIIRAACRFAHTTSFCYKNKHHDLATPFGRHHLRRVPDIHVAIVNSLRKKPTNDCGPPRLNNT